MADNVPVTPGSGVTIATRDIGGGVEAQRVIPQTYSTPGSAGGAATDVGASNPLPVQAVLKDGNTSNLATIAVLHNSDNQSPSSLGFGLLTGGVPQLVNAAGNLDRQREAGIDNIPQSGLAASVQQLASPFSTTIAASVSTGTQTVTPAAMSGTNRGGAWAIQIGSILTIANSNGTNSENVVVTSVTGTTFSAVFASPKTGPGITLQGYTYNQARDSTAPDGSTGQGLAAGATYLFNPNLNSGTGGWESERSAAGEQDGGNGTGLAAGSEYLHNSGGPVLISGLASGLTYDRARGVQGKGLATATISSGATNGSTTITVTSAAAVNLLRPGSPLYLLTGSQLTEIVYVSQAYVPGTATINLQNAVVTGGETNVAFDIHAPSGPGTNGFSPTGVGVIDEVVWDPISNRYYIERSATADGVSANNVVLKAPAFYNGATFDRAYNNVQGTILASAAQTATVAGPSLTNFNARGVTLYINVTSASGTLTPSIQGQDPVSNNWFNLFTAGVSISSTGQYVYQVYPGASAAGALTAAAPLALPRIWRANFVIGGGSPSFTFSAGYAYTV